MRCLALIGVGFHLGAAVTLALLGLWSLSGLDVALAAVFGWVARSFAPLTWRAR